MLLNVNVRRGKNKLGNNINGKTCFYYKSCNGITDIKNKCLIFYNLNGYVQFKIPAPKKRCNNKKIS